MTTIFKEYKRFRAKGWRAKEALRTARVNAIFEDTPGVRLTVLPDYCLDLDNLKGDTFNPEANPDIPASRLEREEREFEALVNRESVWGIVGEYTCPCCGQWIGADSVWGFVGDSYEDSGYDTDVKEATLAAAKFSFSEYLKGLDIPEAK